jgi:DNA-binding NarL/FixJ family response regulator
MRVAVAAENRTIADAIRRALRYASPCYVIGFVIGDRACPPAIIEAAPDVVVIDERPSIDGTLGLVRRMRGALPESKLVLLSSQMDSTHLALASRAGIDSAVSRSIPASSIGLLVRELAGGHVYTTFETSVARPANDATGTLTPREFEVLLLVASGLTNGDIADRLYVTEQTVKYHLSNVFRKLGLKNRTEASHFAHRYGLLGPWGPAAVRSVPVAA